MQFDEAEELQEPKLCCYRKRWIASRALIWSFVSIGATLFSIGYVLKVFTAHYPDDPDTASIFDISGITLVSVGAILTSLGIVACFHSCCIVLCHRPTEKTAEKSEQKNGSQKSNSSSEKSEKHAILQIPTLQIDTNQPQSRPHFEAYPYSSEPSIKQPQQQRHFFVSGGPCPVLPNKPATPPPPQRSATSPKFLPLQDDNDIVPPWSQPREGERRRHKSQGSVRQPEEWSDSETPLPVDKAPESGETTHPYTDDYLQQHLRKKLTTTAAEFPASESAKSAAMFVPQDYPTSQAKSPGKIRPLFRTGPPPVEKRDGGHVNSSNNNQQQPSCVDRSPRTPRNPNSVRHRQYFHEEHFAFSDFEPEDTFLPTSEQQQLLQKRNDATSVMTSNVATAVPRGSEQQARLPSRSPVLSDATRTDIRKLKQPITKQHQYANCSPKLSHSIPAAAASNVNVPVNSSPLTTAYLQQHHRHPQIMQHFNIDVESNTPLLSQTQMSGGSTSSGRGAGHRGGTDGATTCSYAPNSKQSYPLPNSSVPAVQPSSSAVVSVAMASPCLVRRVSPAFQRRQSPSSGQSRDQTSDLSALDQSSSVISGQDVELNDFIKPLNGKIKFSNPVHSVPHRPSSETVFRSAVIRGQLPNQHQFDEEDADNDNTSPDPDDNFPTSIKSPKRDRLMKINETRNTLPSAFVNDVTDERALKTYRNKTSGVLSSSLVSHLLPAQDPYTTTQAFLCEHEEII